jgi:hypothetical protein
VRILQDPAGLLQTGEERRPTPGPAPGGQPLAGGDGLRPLGQVLDAEQLTADRTGEQVLAGVGSKKRGEDGKGAACAGRDGGASRVGYGLFAIGYALFV